jgi:ribosomal protein S18 acetylase RimI-like enzyme
VIRTAQPADVPAVLDLWGRERSEYVTTADSEKVVTRLLDRDPDALLVAELDGRLVGTLIASWDGWRGYYYRLVVEPDLRRRGVARALVDAAEVRLRGLGAPRVIALVGRGDERAAAFWTAIDYPYDERVGRHFRDLAPETGR